jgi:hypothetical protein
VLPAPVGQKRPLSMTKKQEFATINPKALIRRMALSLPRESGEDSWASHLILALYSYSNTFFEAELVERGILDFTSEASYQQIGDFMGMTESGAKQCCARFKERFGNILTSKRGKYSNLFTVRLREIGSKEPDSKSGQPIEKIEIAYWGNESACRNPESAFSHAELASPEAPLSLICRLLSSSGESASGGSAPQKPQDKIKDQTSGLRPEPSRDATQTSRTQAAPSGKAGSSESPARTAQGAFR